MVRYVLRFGTKQHQRSAVSENDWLHQTNSNWGYRRVNTVTMNQAALMIRARSSR